MNDTILRLALVQDKIPDLKMEMFLSGKPGIVGAIGMQRIAEDHEKQVKEKKLANDRATSFKKVIEKVAKVSTGVASDAVLSAEAFDSFIKKVDEMDVSKIDGSTVSPFMSAAQIEEVNAAIFALDTVASVHFNVPIANVDKNARTNIIEKISKNSAVVVKALTEADGADGDPNG